MVSLASIALILSRARFAWSDRLTSYMNGIADTHTLRIPRIYHYGALSELPGGKHFEQPLVLVLFLLISTNQCV